MLMSMVFVEVFGKASALGFLVPLMYLNFGIEVVFSLFEVDLQLVEVESGTGALL